MRDYVDVLIIGSGPAAWTAAIYAARADLKPFVVAGFLKGGIRGGQLMTTTEVENYPGFVDGIQGPELMDVLEKQARRFGTEILETDVQRIDVSKYPFVVETKKGNITAQSVIVATGAYAKRLEVEGGEEFWTKGVSACAVCDGALPLFRDKELLVIGGGDSACEEALYLTKFGTKVHVALRRDEFRASKIMAERVKNNEKIEVHFNHQLKKITGDNLVSGSILVSNDGVEKELAVAGVFFAIGHTPNSDFLDGDLQRDESGYIQVEGFTSKTSVPGLFAAGDVCDKRYRQAVTSAGMGCMAALDAEKFLAEIKDKVSG
ncbi:MAG: Thioredoxin reductase [Chlamydiia bacterium]|nr:Thioredoxin reductase [Chlamydiia bacterium]